MVLDPSDTRPLSILGSTRSNYPTRFPFSILPTIGTDHFLSVLKRFLVLYLVGGSDTRQAWVTDPCLGLARSLRKTDWSSRHLSALYDGAVLYSTRHEINSLLFGPGLKNGPKILSKPPSFQVVLPLFSYNPRTVD